MGGCIAIVAASISSSMSHIARSNSWSMKWEESLSGKHISAQMASRTCGRRSSIVLLLRISSLILPGLLDLAALVLRTKSSTI